MSGKKFSQQACEWVAFAMCRKESSDNEGLVSRRLFVFGTSVGSNFVLVGLISQGRLLYIGHYFPLKLYRLMLVCKLFWRAPKHSPPPPPSPPPPTGAYGLVSWLRESSCTYQFFTRDVIFARLSGYSRQHLVLEISHTVHSYVQHFNSLHV